MGKWSQAILSQEGDVYGVPWSAEKVLKIRPLTDQADGMGTLDIDTAVTAVTGWRSRRYSTYRSVGFPESCIIMYRRIPEVGQIKGVLERIYGCSCLGSLPVFSPHRPITGVCMLAKVTSRRFGRHKSSIRILMASGWCFCKSCRSRKPIHF